MTIANVDPSVGLALILLPQFLLALVGAGVASRRFFVFNSIGPIWWLAVVAGSSAPLLALALLQLGWNGPRSGAGLVLASAASVMLAFVISLWPAREEL